MRPAQIIRTHRRFSVGPPPDGFRDAYIAALNDNAFRETENKLDTSVRFGWCDAANPLITDFFDLNRWLYNQYATFDLRIEERRVSAARLRATCEKRQREWCQANNRERCPSRVREELREQVEIEMLMAGVEPRMQVYGVLWNIAEGWLLTSATSTTRLDTLRKLFQRTFGLALTPADPLDLVSTEIGCALLDGRGYDLAPGAGVEIPELPDPADEVASDGEGDEEREAACPPHVAGDFLLWLWHRTSAGRGALDLPDGSGRVEWWMDGRIDFRQAGEDRTIASVANTDDQPIERSGAALAALAHGGIVKTAGIALRREDREYRLNLTGPLLDRKGIKIPSLVRAGDAAEHLYETAFLYEEVEYLLGHLFRVWASQRVHQGTQGEAAIRRWLGLELAHRFDANGQGMLFARERAA